MVNGKIEEEIKKLDEVALRQAESNRNTLDVRRRDAENRYNDGYGVDGSAVNWAGNDPKAVDIYNSLKAIGIADGEIVKFATDLGLTEANAEEALAPYRAVLDALLADDSWEELWSADRSQDILNHVQSQIEVYESVISEYQEVQRNFLENEAIIDQFNYLKVNDVDTQEAFDTYIAGIQSSSEYSNEYKDVCCKGWM